MDTGTRVRLAQPVERYPHFTAPAGREGMVTRFEDDQISVRLDEPLEGAEDWDNEIHWYSDMFVDEDFKGVFEEQVEVIGTKR